MNAALLGLTDEAATLVLQRAKAPSAKGYRFPAFMAADYDYPPSADHLANMNSALQWMLLQNANDVAGTIVLFPAWPCDWDVDFKLWGSLRTSVEVQYANGALVKLTVDPPTRAPNIVFANCVE
jgi:hypothetical protein